MNIFGDFSEINSFQKYKRLFEVRTSLLFFVDLLTRQVSYDVPDR